jgi:microcystin-dependent protein
MSDPFIGEIRMVGFNFPPRGWATCDGQLLAIASNTALFSILGTTYGGDGRVTFALPDLRGRTPIHKGQGPGLSSHSLGEKWGYQTHSLSVNQTPAHRHTGRGTSDSAEESEPAGNLPAGAEGNTYRSATAPGGTNVVSMGATAPTGGNQPHTNEQPYLALYFVIALVGLFPSRN